MIYKERPYQATAQQFLLDNYRAGLLIDMGLGKTIVTLTVIMLLLYLGEIKRVLIVAPKRVAESTWPAEIEKWVHLAGLRLAVLVGNKAYREQESRKDADIYVINFENLKWLMEHHGKKWPYDFLVVDEATRVKSPTALTTRLLRRVCRHTKRFAWLTGTGAPNGLQDLWAPMYLLDQGARLGKGIGEFRQRYCQPCGFELRQWCMREGAEKEIYEKIGDIVLSMKSEDYIDLPPVIENTIEVDLPEDARALYKQMEDEFFLELAESSDVIEAVNAGAKAMKLRQLASGFVFDESGEWHEVHRAKIEALEEIVTELNGQPALIAYYFQPDLERIKQALPEAQRLSDAEDIKRWNEGSIPLALVHPACLGAETQVLTENRGWVPIVEVRKEERVFDGVEYVAHSGCMYSGFKEVIEVFGITMTPDHKLLISGKWEIASNVQDCRRTRRAAGYKARGAAPGNCRVSKLRCEAQDTEAERGKTQQNRVEALQILQKRTRTNWHKDTQYLAKNARTLRKAASKGLQALRCAGDTCLRKMAGLQELLRRYARRLHGRNDHRADRCKWGLLQGELLLGNKHGAAGQQTQQQGIDIRGQAVPFSGAVPRNWGKQDENAGAFIARDDTGGSSCRRSRIDLRKRELGTEVRERAHVFDLANCGPRSRFLIRNREGEVFVSHNSHGHGLNLQDGGHHIVFYSLDWNLDNHLQLRKRLHRSGQQHPVIEHYIEARQTVDGLIKKRLSTKRSVQDLLFEALKAR